MRPCTKGLWMWSAPIRRTAVDGTSYQLLLLDSEGIDAWDQASAAWSWKVCSGLSLALPCSGCILPHAVPCLQTGQYSTQIFSLAVLLSSLFVYNQMGGIDEAALDRLSLVTEMTKHIRVRAGAALMCSQP